MIDRRRGVDHLHKFFIKTHVSSRLNHTNTEFQVYQQLYEIVHCKENQTYIKNFFLIICVYIPYQSKVWTHLLIQLFSLFLLFSTLEINTEDINTMKEHIWNYIVNKNVLNKPEYVLYFRFFEVATFCFDSFAHSCHCLSQLREVVS